MADLEIDDILRIDEATYSKHFPNPDFGLTLATDIVAKHSLPSEIKRKTEGSSLVFELGPDLFLKISPPFFFDSFDAELAATLLVSGRLSVRVPEVVLHDSIGNWKYLVSRRVPGKQARHVYRELTENDLSHLATEVGALIASYRSVSAPQFERTFGPWDAYLSQRLANQRSVHLARGNSPEWVDKICTFVKAQSHRLLALGPPVLVHADLNRDHVMLDQINGRWKIVGLLDLADSMKAPKEFEFILPFIDFFHGRSLLQKQVLRESGVAPCSSEDFSRLLLALALQNRFMAFHDWFRRELKTGAATLDEIAFMAFPPS